MKQEKFLSIEEVQSLNIANIVQQEFKAVAKIKKTKDMNTEEVKKELSGFRKTLDEIKALFVKSEVKALMFQDVNGVEIDVPDIETMEQLTTGLSATIEGSPASGEYVIENGNTLVFSEGVLTEIKEPEGDEDLEALKTENETLKNELETLKAQLTDQTEAITAKEKEHEDFKTDAEAKILALTEDFEAFKGKFSKSFVDSKIPEGTGGEPNVRSAFKKKD